MCEEGFKEELITFLHNGQQFRTELIEPLRYKLQKLHKVIEKQHSFRFYSSSLLLMYEGHIDETKEQENGRSKQDQVGRNNSSSLLNKVDVRMIDFAHTTHSGFSAGYDS